MTAAIVIAAVVVFIIGLFAVIVERTEQRDRAYRLAAEAQQAATKAVNQAETFRKTAAALANELKAEQRRSNAADKAVVRLVAEKLRLSNDLFAAHKRISDAENVIPLPVQRDGSHDDLAALDAEATEYTWPSIDRQIKNDEWTALMRAVEED